MKAVLSKQAVLIGLAVKKCAHCGCQKVSVGPNSAETSSTNKNAPQSRNVIHVVATSGCIKQRLLLQVQLLPIDYHTDLPYQETMWLEPAQGYVMSSEERLLLQVQLLLMRLPHAHGV